VSGYDVAITGGSTASSKDFGDTTNILLAGTVYNDANSNGVQDNGELGIPGVVINVISNNTIVATRTTDAAGKWQVKGLSAGSGEVDVVVPAGYTVTSPASGKYVGSASSAQRIGNLNFALHKTTPPPMISRSVAAMLLTDDIERVIGLVA